LLPFSSDTVTVPSGICKNTTIKQYRTVSETVNITAILEHYLEFAVGPVRNLCLEHSDPRGRDWHLLTSQSEQDNFLSYPLMTETQDSG
jgi:hypothetical protein